MTLVIDASGRRGWPRRAAGQEPSPSQLSWTRRARRSPAPASVLRASGVARARAISTRCRRSPSRRAGTARSRAASGAGVWHATRTSAGDATTIAAQRARDVATFSRLREYRNSIPRGASSAVERRHRVDRDRRLLALEPVDGADPRSGVARVRERPRDALDVGVVRRDDDACPRGRSAASRLRDPSSAPPRRASSRTRPAMTSGLLDRLGRVAVVLDGQPADAGPVRRRDADERLAGERRLPARAAARRTPRR